MSRVELINIGLDGFNKWDMWESLGLEYLAASLEEKNIDCGINNVNSSNMDECLNLLSENKPLIVGFTLPCYYESKLEYMGNRLKELLPDVHITLGNRFATDNVDFLFSNHMWIDSIMRGEGERTIVELYNRINNKESLQGCEGVYFRNKSGEIIKNRDRELVNDLDELPIIKHRMIRDNGVQHAWFCSSRGCVNDCAFCNSRCDRVQSGKIIRLRTPENVIEELKYLYYELKCTDITFVDCSYEDPGRVGKERIKRIAELIIQNEIKIKYGVYFSAHNWHEEDGNLLRLLHESGLVCAYIGFESGYPDTLKLFNKRATVQDNENVIKLLKKYGISIKYGFIMNHPYLTVDEFIENNEFLYRNGIAYCLGSYYNELYVMKGTKFFEKVDKEGLFTGKINKELGAFEWSFSDEGAKKIHEKYLSIEDEPVVSKLKSSEWSYRVIDIRNYFHGIDFTDGQRNVHESFIKSLDDNISKINELNYLLAKNIVSIVKNNIDDAEFISIKNDYCNKVKVFIENIDSEILRYIYKIMRR